MGSGSKLLYLFIYLLGVALMLLNEPAKAAAAFGLLCASVTLQRI
jgi:hypothetical protein